MSTTYISNKMALRISAISLFVFLFPALLSAYQIEADFLNPDAVVFQIGQFVSDDLSGGGGVDFNNIPPIFWLRVDEDNNPDDDPDEVILMVRLEVAQGGAIFTASSQVCNIRRALIPRGRMTNQQLATIPDLRLASDRGVDASNLMQHIEGGMMREGVYILTVLITDRDAQGAGWQYGINNNYGIHSATVRTESPSSVELLDPRDNSLLTNNPVFSWQFPRRKGIKFRLEVAAGDPNMDPSAALDFANDQTRCLDKTIELGAGVSGDRTTYNYTGTGQERRLENGKTYFWRVTAISPSMIGDEGISLQSTPYSFRYGRGVTVRVNLVKPTPNTRDNPPVFEWRLTGGANASRFTHMLFNSGGMTPIRSIPMAGGSSKEYTYIEELEMGSTYDWQVKAELQDGGEVLSDKSSFTIVSRAVNLVSPVDGAILSETSPEFRWDYEGDIGASRYILEIFEAGGASPVVTETITGRGRRDHTLDTELTEGVYSWHVRAVFGGGSEVVSAMSNFEIAMPDVRLIRPLDGWVVAGHILMNWEVTGNPDVDRFVAEVYRTGQNQPYRSQESSDANDFSVDFEDLSPGNYSCAVNMILSGGQEIRSERVDVVWTDLRVTNEMPRHNSTVRRGDIDFSWSTEGRMNARSLKLVLYSIERMGTEEFDVDNINNTEITIPSENLEPGDYNWYIRADFDEEIVTSSRFNLTVTNP